MAEAFSSPGGVHGERPQAASIPGINHGSIGTRYDNYVGGISAPTNNPEVTQSPQIFVRTVEPFAGTVGSYPGLYSDCDDDSMDSTSDS